MSGVSFGAEELGDLPFLPEAGDLIMRRGYAMSISELAENWNEPFIRAGIDRARSAVIGGGIDPGALDGMPPEHRILSFVVAALIVRATDNQYAIRRFALAEARYLEDRVMRRIRTNAEDGRLLLTAIYSRVLGMPLVASARRIGGQVFDVRLGLKHYLSLSSSLDASRWGIVTRAVDGGQVYMKLEDASRLLRSGIAGIIENRIMSMKIADLPGPLAEEASGLLKEMARTRPSAPAGNAPIDRSRYPPCVRSLLKRLESGENLPHSARFFLATFMVNAGVPIDDVVAAFSRSPDFNERITRYQVEHIAGIKGGKRYSVPSCSKLEAQGLCARDETCNDIRSPMSYPGRRGIPRPDGGGGGGGGTGIRRRRDRISEDEL